MSIDISKGRINSINGKVILLWERQGKGSNAVLLKHCRCWVILDLIYSQRKQMCYIAIGKGVS